MCHRAAITRFKPLIEMTFIRKTVPYRRHAKLRKKLEKANRFSYCIAVRNRSSSTTRDTAGFASLARLRLLERLDREVRNGPWTERRLAKAAGLSQPHVHNALRRVRKLTVESMDTLMSAAGLSPLDLIDPAELMDYLRGGRATEGWLEFEARWMKQEPPDQPPRQT